MQFLRKRRAALQWAAENAEKGAWGMPRLSEAMKDATSCDKLRIAANTL